MTIIDVPRSPATFKSGGLTSLIAHGGQSGQLQRRWRPQKCSHGHRAGFFTDDTYSEISAQSVYVTFHPSEGTGIIPDHRVTEKAKYKEDLLDGLYVFHNPFAKRSLPRNLFEHPRTAQFFVKPSGELEIVAPDDMLLVRFLWTVNTQEQADALAQAFGLDPRDFPRP